MILPALALALPIAVAVGRSLNGALHDVMRQPYIRTARGKGLSEINVLLRHGLAQCRLGATGHDRSADRPLFGNLLVVERIFAWPGLGLYAVQAFASADLPAVLGVSIVFGTFYILVSIASKSASRWPIRGSISKHARRAAAARSGSVKPTEDPWPRS